MEWVGLVASALTTSSFLPQAVRTVRTRDTSALSLPAYVLLMTGIVLWTAYGLYFDLPPVWLGNLVTGLAVAVILAMKLREAKPK